MKKIILLWLFLFSEGVLAENWYRVELIVFENLYPNAGGELWTKHPGLPDNGSSVELIRGQEGDTPGVIAFQTLDKSKLTLSGTYSTLRGSSRYRPLGYLAWQQPSLESNRSRSVKVNLANEQGELLVLGNIKIRSSLYLHVDLDLAYAIDGIGLNSVSRATTTESGHAVTRLTETRRVKLNDIHYFDHPLFSAIVRVVRLNS